jgi:hypothetical protein
MTNLKRTSGQPTVGKPTAFRRRFFAFKLALIGFMAALLIAIVFVESTASNAKAVESSFDLPKGITSFYDLMELKPEELAATDIAVKNLLCAVELPGAENCNVSDCLRTLGDWAARVKSETGRYAYKFRDNPAEFQNSMAYYKMIMLVTVLQQDFGVRYNPERAMRPDFTDSRDLFIHGLLGEKRTGTCLSMPVLYIAIGRRLGYPLFLAQSKAHLYVKWEDQYEKLNIEATSQGIICRDDEYYANWPEPLNPREMNSGAYLRKLNASEELSAFLTARGHCLEDTSRLPEAQAAYALAHARAPNMPNSLGFLAIAIQRQSPVLAAIFAPARRFPSSSIPARQFPSVEEINELNRRALERSVIPQQHTNPFDPVNPNPTSPFGW